MYTITGVRKNGSPIDLQFDNFKIAQFEYDCIKMVAQKIQFFKGNDLLDSHEVKKPKLEKYIVESPKGKYEFTFEQLAIKCFKEQIKLYSWSTLYAQIAGEKKILDYYRGEMKVC